MQTRTLGSLTVSVADIRLTAEERAQIDEMVPPPAGRRHAEEAMREITHRVPWPA
ncbi:hypothetical protein ACFW16_25105 [Inquilinus sp. NPDC058860]|uniref:hypothetical protein n=1 Tax=Inquilinus sp. NPDC058860 TaxID=3346652 RepID=UPI0036858B68